MKIIPYYLSCLKKRIKGTVRRVKSLSMVQKPKISHWGSEQMHTTRQKDFRKTKRSQHDIIEM